MTINRGLAPDGVEMALSKIITRISGKEQIAQFLAMMSRIANKSTMIFIGEGAPTNEPCLGKITKNGANRETLSNSGERPLRIKIMVGKSSSGSRCLTSSMSFLTSGGRRRNKG